MRKVKENIREVKEVAEAISPVIIAGLIVMFMCWLMKESANQLIKNANQHYKDTATTIPKITKLSSEVSKLCLYRHFHLHNININITPQLKKAYSDANCTLNISNQSCTCTTYGHTLKHAIHATTICIDNKSITNCSTKVKLLSHNKHKEKK